MSLLTDAFEQCVRIHKTTQDDGYGGEIVAWVDGATFDAAITFDSSMQARVAQSQGVTSLYTVTTKRNRVLEFHDVFRRKSDSKVFRVTSDGDDKYTPASTNLDMRQVTAEEWRIPTYGQPAGS